MLIFTGRYTAGPRIWYSSAIWNTPADHWTKLVLFGLILFLVRIALLPDTVQIWVMNSPVLVCFAHGEIDNLWRFLFKATSEITFTICKTFAFLFCKVTCPVNQRAIWLTFLAILCIQVITRIPGCVDYLFIGVIYESDITQPWLTYKVVECTFFTIVRP